MTTDTQVANLVTRHDDNLVTTSKRVAEVFGRQHRDVVSTIEALIPQLPPDHARNFSRMILDFDVGKGATRQHEGFELTRDGFTLLVTGFTGAKALQFKIAYIDAFNAMEKELHRLQVENTALLEAKNAQLVHELNVIGRDIGFDDPVNGVVHRMVSAEQRLDWAERRACIAEVRCNELEQKTAEVRRKYMDQGLALHIKITKENLRPIVDSIKSMRGLLKRVPYKCGPTLKDWINDIEVCVEDACRK